jgi:TetR/AcrR family transcriptional repressor of nem operon
MGRVSQVQAQENRAKVVAAAARLLRERGTDVSVAEMMKAVGLTHGGFYKQFASKEALVAEATALAYANLERLCAQNDEKHGGRHDEARRGLIDWYLSADHRDNPADGCPTAALAIDMARDDQDRVARQAYLDGVRGFAAWLAADGQDDALVQLSTMVGALVLARSTEGTDLSDRFLNAAREAFDLD